MGDNKEYFKEGDDVAYKDNLYQRMTVTEIIFKVIEVPDQPKEDGSGFTKKKVKKLDGIMCLWFDKDGNVQEKKFHSHNIVPWRIAEEGALAVHQYLQNI